MPTGPAAEPTQGSFAWYAKKMREHGGATGVASSIYDIESAETQLRRLYGQEKLNTMTRAAEAVDSGAAATLLERWVTTTTAAAKA